MQGAAGRAQEVRSLLGSGADVGAPDIYCRGLMGVYQTIYIIRNPQNPILIIKAPTLHHLSWDMVGC